MAEPVRKTSHGESDEPDDASSGAVMLQRWVERPDGGLELQEKPLTVEDYLDPQLEDKLTQGRPHSDRCRFLAELLSRHFQSDEDVIVLQDVKHLFGPRLPGPSPDVSVVLGARDKEFWTYDAVEQGVFPSFVIEVISPSDARVRRMDEVDKVELYQRVGIPEYLLVDMPRRATGYRFRIKGRGTAWARAGATSRSSRTGRGVSSPRSPSSASAPPWTGSESRSSSPSPANGC
jgi:Uma2 family endonuclease